MERYPSIDKRNVPRELNKVFHGTPLANEFFPDDQTVFLVLKKVSKRFCTTLLKKFNPEGSAYLSVAGLVIGIKRSIYPMFVAKWQLQPIYPRENFFSLKEFLVGFCASKLWKVFFLEFSGNDAFFKAYFVPLVAKTASFLLSIFAGEL